MDVILALVEQQTAFVYLKCIVVIFKTVEEHITHVIQKITLSQKAEVA